MHMNAWCFPKLHPSHQRIRHDHQQEPRTKFADADHMPTGALARINPSGGKRADILREPDKERRQNSRQQ